MGTGWRRALCTSVQRDDHDDAKTKKQRRPADAAPRSAGFFSAVKSAATGGGSNPSTPTLRCRTRPLQEPAEPAPVTPPSASAPASAPLRRHRMPLLQALSAPASPRSPSRFALLKASLLPSKGLNLVLRLAWLQTVIHPNFGSLDSRVTSLFLAALEVIRRGHWNFYRLENEHLNNAGKFQSVKTVPLPFHEVDED